MPSPPAPDTADLAELLARQRIAQLLTRYCRGIDRCDLETLSSVFWPDATCDYGAGAQNALDWARATIGGLKAMLRTQHSISNMLIDIDGERARAETYCHAYHELESPTGRTEMVVGGRYLDHLEFRNGEWRIARRDYVMDWNRNVPSTCEWESGIYAGLRRRGARKPDDPLYPFLAGG